MDTKICQICGKPSDQWCRVDDAPDGTPCFECCDQDGEPLHQHRVAVDDDDEDDDTIYERTDPQGRKYIVAIEENNRGRRRYSADGGLTWAKTATRAFAAAERRKRSKP